MTNNSQSERSTGLGTEIQCVVCLVSFPRLSTSFQLGKWVRFVVFWEILAFGEETDQFRRDCFFHIFLFSGAKIDEIVVREVEIFFAVLLVFLGLSAAVGNVLSIYIFGTMKRNKNSGYISRFL